MLDPFYDRLVHAFVSEMVRSQEAFRTKEFTHSLLLDMGCMPCASYHSKRIPCAEYQSCSFFLCSFFLSSSRFLPLRVIPSCDHPVFSRHSLCPRNVRDQVSDPYETAAQTRRQKDNDQNDSKQLPNLIPS